MELDPTLKSLAVEARARIIWGDSPADIRQWLSAKGLPTERIEFIIDYCTRERGRIIREMGLRDLIIGGSVMLLGTLVCIAVFFPPNTFYLGRLMGLGCLGAIYGLWRALRGMERILSGAKTEGSVPDMDG